MLLHHAHLVPQHQISLFQSNQLLHQLTAVEEAKEAVVEKAMEEAV